MCLLKQKIARSAQLAAKKPVVVQDPNAIKVEAVDAKPNVASKSIEDLKKALSAFVPVPKQEKVETMSSDNLSTSTEHESQSEKKKKAPAAVKPKKAPKEVKEVKEAKEDKHNGSPTKNIAINFGKAMASFALSHIAIPYIMDYIENSDLTLQDFFIFVKKNKKCIKSMQGLRSLLLVNEQVDDKTTAGYKRVFQKICELFVKNYSVNWIVHSKLSYKLVYLKWRFKMLRRIRNPELFTHIC